MQYPILLTLFGFWHIPIALLVFQLTDTLMLQEAESKIRERDSRIHMMPGGFHVGMCRKKPGLKMVDSDN